MFNTNSNRMSSTHSRQQILQYRIERLKRRNETLQIIYRRLALLRLSVFFLGIILGAGISLQSPLAGGLVLAAFAVVFTVIALRHQKIARSIRRFELVQNLDRAQLARLELNWEQIPAPTPLDRSAKHPYDFDLDILGDNSLQQLLDTSVTRGGARKLADWLLDREPALIEIRQRQTLLRELIPLRRLRERLRLDFGFLPKGKLDGSRFVQWLDQQRQPLISRAAYVAGLSLAVLNAALLALHLLAGWPPVVIVSFVVYTCLLMLHQLKLGRLFGDAMIIEDELRSYRAVLQRLEHFSYRNSPGLADLCAPLRDPRQRPSDILKSVSRLLLGISSRANPMVYLLLNVALPTDFILARRLWRVQEHLRERVPAWLDLIYQMEALLSLANFAWLHPDYRFPELEESTTEKPPALRARSLGHPLLHAGKRVANDAAIENRGTVCLITGSNMSGKSTFLRTIGVNLVLAYAGAPVVAQDFHTTLFRLFTCIRISDSIADGLSYFYAEVRRLRMMLDEARRPDSRPLFYLIDEIFKGTNNVERLVGSRSYIRSIARHNTLGLVTTHDLELTLLADEIEGFYNFHFREQLSQGQMSFDYRLHRGPCPTTNALKIMALEGLPVEDQQKVEHS